MLGQGQDKEPNSLHLVHLPNGPTALFKLSSLVLPKEVYRGGRQGSNAQHPEVILNNFESRLGHTVGRMLAALFPQAPEFEARRAVTFHAQRDFIFLRHHRYDFADEGERARLQELGPRCTLKLQTLQRGAWDPNGEFEFVRKADTDTSKRRFNLN